MEVKSKAIEYELAWFSFAVECLLDLEAAIDGEILNPVDSRGGSVRQKSLALQHPPADA